MPPRAVASVGVRLRSRLNLRASLMLSAFVVFWFWKKWKRFSRLLAKGIDWKPDNLADKLAQDDNDGAGPARSSSIASIHDAPIADPYSIMSFSRGDKRVSRQVAQTNAIPISAVLNLLSPSQRGDAVLHGVVTSVVPALGRFWSARTRAVVRGAVAKEQARKLFTDMALTQEQQELAERVIECNVRFWTLSVGGGEEQEVPWRRHVFLNLALLRIYQCHIAAQRCESALRAEPEAEPPMSREEACNALRSCRWMIASYGGRHGWPPHLRKDLPANRVPHAAAVAGVEPSAIIAAELKNQKQLRDPLCPRFLVGVDLARNEVVISIRGTSSISDALCDLVGDPVPFAGGLSHAGMVDAARRLRANTEEPFRAALEKLRLAEDEADLAPMPPQLVLTGHSLGAGVASLLAIILCGGDEERGSGWLLPAGVRLRTYIFAPPPAYKAVAGEEDPNGAVARAKACAVGYAANYDIIPRTSLHNGYNLFQLARAVDLHLPWRKVRVLKALRETDHKSKERQQQARRSIVEAVSSAIERAAVGPPAAPNPFAQQHPVVARMHFIVSAPGGTAAFDFQGALDGAPAASSGAGASSTWFRQRLPQSLHSAAVGPGDDIEAGWRNPGLPKKEGWLLNHRGVAGWRQVLCKISGGELRLFTGLGSEPSHRVPLTAAATTVELFGIPSFQPFPISVVKMWAAGNDDASAVFAASDASSDGEFAVPTAPPSYSKAPQRRLSKTPPMPWVFEVQTAEVGGICAHRASKIRLVCDSAESRDDWVGAVVGNVRAARRGCIRFGRAMSAEDFGRETLLADGFVDDHAIIRYEAALETLLEAVLEGG